MRSDAEQRLPRKGPPEAIVQEPVKRPDAERPYRHQLHTLCAQSPLHR